MGNAHPTTTARKIVMLVEEMRIRLGSKKMVFGQLSHQAGLFVIPIFLQYGTLLLMQRFDLGSVAEILSTQEISCAQVVPTMFTLSLDREKLYG